MSRTDNAEGDGARGTLTVGEAREGFDEDSKPKRRFATRLYDLRTLRQETQRQVAADLGVATATYSSWERGERELKAEHIKDLARHFGVSPNEILGVGEVADEIPVVTSELERLIQLYLSADLGSRKLAEGALTLGATRRHR